MRRVFFPYDHDGKPSEPPTRKIETWAEVAKRLWPDDDVPNW